MITALEVINKIFNTLPAKPVKYRITQPVNTPDEYIIINSLILQGRQLQTGVFNVNIHVKNIAQPDGSQPNFDRLNTISKDVMFLLDQIWGDNKLISIDDAGGVFREENGYHFVNLRINYKQYNL